jgi:hypothetical protein
LREFFSTARDGAFSVADLCERVFALQGMPARREQRLSTVRAANRLFDRYEAAEKAVEEAAEKAALEAGGWSEAGGWPWAAMNKNPTLAAARAELPRWQVISRWRRSSLESRRLVFHLRNFPLRVWAVQVVPGGVLWAEVEIVAVHRRRVSVRYQEVRAVLDRETLADGQAVWRGVYFSGRRDGQAAEKFDLLWQRLFGDRAGVGGAPAMPPLALDEARRRLGLSADFSLDDIKAAFRGAALQAHPDHGGSAEVFRRLIEARDRLLRALGVAEPTEPMFVEKGVPLRYTRVQLDVRSRRIDQRRQLGLPGDRPATRHKAGTRDIARRG